MIIGYVSEDLAFTARGMGAPVIGGPVRHRSRDEVLDVSNLDIETRLRELKDEGVVGVETPREPARKVPGICELCGTPYEEGECPHCKADQREAKRVVEERLLFDEGFSALLDEG